jgi:hypothetical protein
MVPRLAFVGVHVRWERLIAEVSMRRHIDHDQHDRFPTDPSGLPEASRLSTTYR